MSPQCICIHEDFTRNRIRVLTYLTCKNAGPRRKMKSRLAVSVKGLPLLTIVFGTKMVAKQDYTRTSMV